MPNAVPIDKITEAVFEAGRQALNGLIRLQKAGNLTLTLLDRPIEITIPVAIKDGINAIPRTVKTVNGPQVTQSDEPEQVTEQKTAARTVTSIVKETSTTKTTSAQEQQTGTETGTQFFGRGTETTTNYEQ